MILRIIEDIVFVARLGYFYRKAPSEIGSVGFNPMELTKRQRISHAWARATFKR